MELKKRNCLGEKNLNSNQIFNVKQLGVTSGARIQCKVTFKKTQQGSNHSQMIEKKVPKAPVTCVTNYMPGYIVVDKSIERLGMPHQGLHKRGI